MPLVITSGEVVAVGGLFCSGLTPWKLDADHLRPVLRPDSVFGDGYVETLVLTHFSAILSGSWNLLGLENGGACQYKTQNINDSAHFQRWR